MNNYQRRVYEAAKRAYSALIKVYPFMLDDLPGEEWLPVPDYDDYHVSNFGRVKSFHKSKPLIVKPTLSRNGYLQVGLHKDDKQKIFRVHRLIALCFIPNPEGKPTVNHRDGVKFNCHVSNLEWSTRAENLQHAVATGLKKSGKDHYKAKFTNEQILFMRDNPRGLNVYQLSDMFGVHPTVISAIQLGKTYRDAGGFIRKANPKPPRLPDDIRNQIRAEYVFGSKEFGARALAKKYGVSHRTIWNIVNEV